METNDVVVNFVNARQPQWGRWKGDASNFDNEKIVITTLT
jgi:hypothetical protein